MESYEDGYLVAFEGIDSAGKTSLISLLESRLRSLDIVVSVFGELQSPLTSVINCVLESGGTPYLKTLLFAADRAWHYEHMISCLRLGHVCLWDRYTDSAQVYRQAEADLGQDVDLDLVRVVNAPFIRPHLTILVDISVQTSITRSVDGERTQPYSDELLSCVHHRYQKLATNRVDYLTINGEAPLDHVLEQVLSGLLSTVRPNSKSITEI